MLAALTTSRDVRDFLPVATLTLYLVPGRVTLSAQDRDDTRAQSRDDTPAGGGHGERGGTTTGGATPPHFGGAANALLNFSTISWR
jgi:hypothetical protein